MWDVIWSDEAGMQYMDVLSFWVDHNLSNTYSLKIVDAVEKAENRLIENPFAGEEKEVYKNGAFFKYRKLVVLHNFSLIYTVKDAIEIVSFWDNRRDPESLKLK